jgi:hypothetical protein
MVKRKRDKGQNYDVAYKIVKTSCLLGVNVGGSLQGMKFRSYPFIYRNWLYIVISSKLIIII